jgi:hypothetical protein
LRCGGCARWSGALFWRCLRCAPVQQRVAAFDVLQGVEHGVGLELVAVRQAPLQFANPHRDAGQFGGVFVQLDAQHVVRAGHQVGLAVQAQLGGLQVAVVFHVFQALEGEVQKVAAAAGGVEGAVVFELVEPGDKQGVRCAVVFVAFFGDFGRQRLYLLALPAPIFVAMGGG